MEFEKALVDAAEFLRSQVGEVDSLECPVALGVGEAANRGEEAAVGEPCSFEIRAGPLRPQERSERGYPDLRDASGRECSEHGLE